MVGFYKMVVYKHVGKYANIERKFYTDVVLIYIYNEIHTNSVSWVFSESV